MKVGHSAVTSRTGSQSSGAMSSRLTDGSDLNDFGWIHRPIPASVQNTSAPGLSQLASGSLNTGQAPPLTHKRPVSSWASDSAWAGGPVGKAIQPQLFS